MNWESIIFFKMYKTNKYKFNPPNYIKLNKEEKLDLYKDLNNQIKEYDLNNSNLYGFNLNINVNKNCALYNLSKNNKNHYFSYKINHIFYFYYKFIIYGREIIGSEKYLNKTILFLWEKYLLHLLFLKEINLDLLKKEIEIHLNEHFKYYCFILGQITHLDIILLSIIIDLDIYDEILNNNNYICFKRWILSFNKIYNIEKEKIIASFKLKEKENLYYTYRLTSCLELVKAVQSLDYEQVEYLLLNEHENVESRREKDHKSLVHLACINGDQKMLLILLKYGCNINSLDFENMTPLYDAITSNNIKFVDFLIKDLKMDINHKDVQNRTPFYWTCCKSNIEMIKYIMSYPEVDINFPSLMGRTALSKSCWNGQLKVVELLCSQPNINTINKLDCNNRSPLHNAVWGEFGGREGKKMPSGSPTDNPEIVQLLIDNGAELEIKDNDGNTPFMISASTNGVESMKILMKYNINLNEINNNYETGLLQAAKYGYYEIIQIFIDYYKNHLNIKNNVDLNKGDKHGYTPIQYTIFYKKVICLKLLFENIDDYKNNDKEKIMELIILTIQSQSKLCFNYLFKKVIKENYFEDIEYYNIIKLILIYENYSFFNFINDNINEKKLLKLINMDHNQELLLYLLILEIQINKNYNIKDIKTKFANKNNNILSEEEKEKLYNKILRKKMSKLSDEEMKLINEDYNKEDNDYEALRFIEKVSNILSKICLYELQNNNIHEKLLSYLIINNKEKEFLSLIQIYSNENLVVNNDKKINFDKNEYYIIKTDKYNITKEKLFNNDKKSNIWINTINYINEVNALFISIEKGNKIYFNGIFKCKYFTKYIFDSISSSHKNILHIMLENFDKDIFEKIINMIENKFKENKDFAKKYLLQMINQIDSSSMVPLDILINKDNSSILYLYTKTINNLCNKYIDDSGNLIGKPIKYDILKFKIYSSPYIIDSSYITKITSEFVQCKKFIQKFKINKNEKESNIKVCSFEEEYQQSKYIINEEFINNIINIINLILENKIEDEFKIINKKYYHTFVDTEEKLIQMKNEIINESILGVDAEFDGEKCGVDGVVCIIQISSFKKTYVVDTLKLYSLIKKYLGEIFENENIVKIFHSCDNDIFWILSNFDIKTINIYDTSRAFAIFQELILNKTFKNANYVSLYYLVVFFLGVKLNKTYQTSNWKIRPLTNAMYQYALNDAKTVLYLYYLFQGLYLYLNKKNFNENGKYKDFYYEIKKKFFKNREDVSLADFNYGDNYYKNCLSKIKLNCLEMVKNRMKNKINKINIVLDNE